MSDRTATERIHFGTIKEAIEPPNLIEVQLNSYVDFLQKDVPPPSGRTPGCKPFSKKFSRSRATTKKRSLDFSHYEIGEPKLSALEAQREGQTYSAPLHVTFQLRKRRGRRKKKFTWAKSRS